MTKELIRLRGCAGWSAPLLFANLRRQVFSRLGPNIVCYFVLRKSTNLATRATPHRFEENIISQGQPAKICFPTFNHIQMKKDRVFQAMKIILGLDARKPVFGVSAKARFKPACSATETNKKIEILLVASLYMILSNK